MLDRTIDVMRGLAVCAVFATRHVFPDGLLTICSGLTLLYIMVSPLLRGNAISTVLGEDSGC